ncbi:tetratricopeptide repeat protein [Streptomyces sp. NRRL F-2580]|uniref:tetratricopeptide repeat protein n=1 Tax=Streptomyces sp. NRRL F-2580 TaxID=1463841 RepID=UPI0004C52768|nr:tetratricopeptide repeat protein [Streptomyces sp. NRRL F-2580]
MEASQHIHAEPGSSVYAVLHGDIHVRNGRPVYQVAPFDLTRRSVPVEAALRQPSRLLAAENRIVPFHGRGGELDALGRWGEGDTARSVALVHAGGGQGKTRLAARLAADSAKRGWTVWAAHHRSDPIAEQVVAPGDPGRTLLLIVDYADRWPADDLLMLLSNPLLNRPGRCRVLLVARSANLWWPALQNRLSKAGLDTGPTLELPALAGSHTDRQISYRVAHRAFADALGVDDPPLPAVPAGLDGTAYDVALTLHMAALVAIDSFRLDLTAPRDPVGLSRYLLDREHDFWLSLHDNGRVSTGPSIMRRAVYTAALTGTLPHAEAATALDRIGLSGSSPSVVVDDHAVCYPPRDPAAGAVLEPLYPDRLAEDFLALSTPGHMCAGYVPDPWAARAAERLLRPEQAPSPPAGGPHWFRRRAQPPPPEAVPYTRSALAVLTDTARRWPHVAERELWPLLRARPQLAVEGGGSVVAALTEIGHVDLPALEAVEKCLPRHQDIDLAPGAAALSRVLTEHRLRLSDSPAERAKLHEALGTRLLQAGLWKEAVASFRSAVSIRKSLPDGGPSSNRLSLASALSDLGMAMHRMGRQQRAVELMGEGILLFRELQQSGVALPVHDFAMALSNLGMALMEMGRGREAEPYTAEGLRLRRRTARSGRPEAEAELAASLDNYGLLLYQRGRPREALPYVRDAAERYTKLHGTHPGRFDEDVSIALKNLGMVLDATGDAPGALDAARKACAIAEGLARRNPSAYKRLHAYNLHGLAIRLHHQDQFEESLSAALQAHEIRSALAQDGTAPHVLHLAETAGFVDTALATLDRPAEAVPYAGEAVGLLRTLYEAEGRIYRAYFAGQLVALAQRLSQVDDPRAAWPVAAEAAGHLRAELRVAPDSPVRSVLLMCLVVWAGLSKDLELWSEALDQITEAVDLYADLPDGGEDDDAWGQLLSATRAEILDALNGGAQDA